jgi:hypothetical protein
MSHAPHACRALVAGLAVVLASQQANGVSFNDRRMCDLVPR